MTIQKPRPKSKLTKPRSSVFMLVASIACIGVLYLVSALISAPGSIQNGARRPKNRHIMHEKYLYWGSRIDCPGKHCDSCAGLGHQESSLRCALEEALFLRRTFVMPSRLCINPIHNKKGILHQSDNVVSEEGWAVIKHRVRRFVMPEVFQRIREHSEMTWRTRRREKIVSYGIVVPSKRRSGLMIL